MTFKVGDNIVLVNCASAGVKGRVVNVDPSFSYPICVCVDVGGPERWWVHERLLALDPDDPKPNLEGLADREALVLTSPPGPAHWRADDPRSLAEIAFAEWWSRCEPHNTQSAESLWPSLSEAERFRWTAIANSVAEVAVARLAKGEK